MDPDDDIQVARERAAQGGRDYLAERISWDDFMNEFGESEDRKIMLLVDLIEHEPQRGGLWGVTEQQWAHYQQQILDAINELSS